MLNVCLEPSRSPFGFLLGPFGFLLGPFGSFWVLLGPFGFFWVLLGESTHPSLSVKKANRKLGLIRRSFTHMDKDMFLALYKSIVRPHLEYGSTIWSTIYKKDKIAIENVQRRATKLVPGIQHLSYSERLRILGIPSLQYRRIRADLVETYKIINDK